LSSPQCPDPLTVQPIIDGYGVHHGACERTITASSASRLGFEPWWYGRTSPCRSQRQALDQRSGSRTGPLHRGQVGSLMRIRSAGAGEPSTLMLDR
jgi:hypothetical protein